MDSFRHVFSCDLLSTSVGKQSLCYSYFVKLSYFYLTLTSCPIDIEAPTIECPPGIEVDVPRWGLNYTIVHYDHQKPHISDNSGRWTDSMAGPTSGSRFYTGHTTLTYTATDEAGLSSSCERSVTVKGVCLIH